MLTFTLQLNVPLNMFGPHLIAVVCRRQSSLSIRFHLNHICDHLKGLGALRWLVNIYLKVQVRFQSFH